MAVTYYDVMFEINFVVATILFIRLILMYETNQKRKETKRSETKKKEEVNETEINKKNKPIKKKKKRIPAWLPEKTPNKTKYESTKKK